MINIIVAYAHHRVIGRAGKIPWHLPADMQHFKRITSGHTVVMGRKTFESIGRPLPQRRNIVLTRRKDVQYPGVEVVHTIDAIYTPDPLFIIGGASIYQQFIEVAGRLYITEVDSDVEGDAFFPMWDRQAFTLISAHIGVLDGQNTIPHTFFVYQRLSL